MSGLGPRLRPGASFDIFIWCPKLHDLFYSHHGFSWKLGVVLNQDDPFL